MSRLFVTMSILSVDVHIVFCFFQDEKVISPERAEEAKLKSRYPSLAHKPGGSDLLRKRLQKGVRGSPLQLFCHNNGQVM